MRCRSMFKQYGWRGPLGLIAILVAFVLARAALAASELPSRAEVRELCDNTAALAEKYMRVHQTGIATLSQVLANQPDELHSLVIAAYSMPRFSTPEYQERMIAEFRNETHVQCLRKWLPIAAH